MKMKYRPIFDGLQNLTRNGKVTHSFVSELLQKHGVDTKDNALRIRYMRDGFLNDNEVEIIQKYISEIESNIKDADVTLMKKFDSTTDYYEIPYWEELPEDLKKKDFTSCHVDREVVENYWKFNYKDLRVLPIFTKQLTYYPEEHFPFGHIALMDMSSIDLNKAGVYCVTTTGGIFIRAFNLLFDGSIQVMDYSEPELKISKTVTAEQLEAVQFKVIGRVFKCVTSRI